MPPISSNRLPTITLQPSARTFPCLPGRSILHSGLAAGIALPYRCSNGSCGDCKARIINGDIASIKHHEYVLSEAQKLSGICLMCSTTAISDVTLEVTEARSVDDIPEQSLPARLCKMEELNGVSIVGVKFSRGNALRFLPGQQVVVNFPSGSEYAHPIASCPCNARYAEFHIQHGDSSNATETTPINEFRRLRAIDKLMIHGPHGRVTLPDMPGRPIVFIARGIGFARMQGMIEQLFDLDAGINSYLIWQATTKIPHYRHNLCRSWADAIDEFHYSAIGADDSASEAVLRQCSAILSGADVFLCEASAPLQTELVAVGATAERISVF